MAHSSYQIRLRHGLCLPSLLLHLVHFNLALVNAQTNFTLDPVINFCSRWWHQSVVKNNVIYVDSGLQKWNGTNVHPPALGMNNYQLQYPLDETWDWKTNLVIGRKAKNGTNPATGTRPPSLMRGHMFHGPANTSEVYVYGGTSYMGPRFDTYAPPESSTYALWAYDPKSPDAPWSQYDIGQAWRPNHGAAAEAIDQGLGFYLHGQIDWGTSPQTVNTMENETDYNALEGMLVINFFDHTSNNISTSGIRGNTSRVGGSMEYLAPVGEMGVLVALGGQLNSKTPFANSSEGELLDFGKVDVYDIESYLADPASNGTWYQQETDGDIPPPRIDFCTVAISAPDNSSHHIYLYGGIDPIKNIPYDDVFVLSLPAFTWTAIFKDGWSPRWGHTCHVVGKRQMVTLGGNITNSPECDWEEEGVAFLEMTTVIWGSVFLTNTTEYVLPSKLLPATKGNPSGGATIKDPLKGWTNEALKTVYNTPRKQPIPSGNPQDPNNPAGPAPAGKKSNAGPIAGGAAAGAVVFVLAISFYLWKRQKDKQAKPVSPAELGDEKTIYELRNDADGKRAELPSSDVYKNVAQELASSPRLYEMDGTTTAELSTENLAKGGRPGIPQVKVSRDYTTEDSAFRPKSSPLATNVINRSGGSSSRQEDLEGIVVPLHKPEPLKLRDKTSR